MTKYVGRGGFEPPKAEPADLQSAPFDRFGTYPDFRLVTARAGEGTRTPDLLITNQLLYQLSYASMSHLTNRSRIEPHEKICADTSPKPARGPVGLAPSARQKGFERTAKTDKEVTIS